MSTKSKNLIIYFPGYTGLPKSKFNPLLRKFRRDGFTTYSVKYNLFGRGDISDLAREAAKQIFKHVDITKFDTVTYIGHSMGGLVARKVASTVSRGCDYLITLGSPHRGVQAASGPFAWLGGKSVLQMRQGSQFLMRCADIGVPALAITGEWDLLVKDASVNTDVPGDCRTQIKNIKVPTTHIGLITGYRTYGEIYSWLVYDQFNKLSPDKEDLSRYATGFSTI